MLNCVLRVSMCVLRVQQGPVAGCRERKSLARADGAEGYDALGPLGMGCTDTS